MEILDVLQGIRIYPGEASLVETQQSVLAWLQNIVVIEQLFRDWEYKVITKPRVLNLMDYWKQATFFYELSNNKLTILTMHQTAGQQFLRKVQNECNLNSASWLEVQKCHCKWLARRLRKIEQNSDVVIHAEDFVVYFFGFQDDKKQAQRQVEMLLSERTIDKEDILLQGKFLQKAIQGKLAWLREQIYDNYSVTLQYLGERVILRGEKKSIEGASKRVKEILQQFSKQFSTHQLEPQFVKILKAFPGTKQMLLRLDLDLLDEKNGIISGHQDQIQEFNQQIKDISKQEQKLIMVRDLDLITPEEFKGIKAKARSIHFCEVQWNDEEEGSAIVTGFFPQNVKSELEKLQLEKTIEQKEEEQEKLNEQYKKLEDDLKNEKKVKEKLQREAKKIMIPDTWAPMGGNRYLLVDIANGTQEFNFVKNRFNNTLQNQIVRLQRIQNPELWKRVKMQEEFIRSEGRDPCVRYMFHGTKTNHPSLIYDNHIGFDFRFSAQGAWGVGAYFAHNSSYSGGGYQHNLPNGNKCLFLVYVVQGLPFKTGGGNYRIPPFINGQNGPRYDSISSNDGSIVIVYEHGKAYPNYLIEYK